MLQEHVDEEFASDEYVNEEFASEEYVSEQYVSEEPLEQAADQSESTVAEELWMIREHLQDGNIQDLNSYRFLSADAQAMFTQIQESIDFSEIDSLNEEIALKEEEIQQLREDVLQAKSSSNQEEVGRLEAEIKQLGMALKDYETSSFVSLSRLRDALSGYGLPFLNSENVISAISERLSEHQQLSEGIKEASLRQMKAEAQLAMLQDKAKAEQARVESLIAEVAILETENSGKDDIISLLRENASKAEKNAENSRLNLKHLRQSEFEITRRTSRSKISPECRATWNTSRN